MGLGGRRLHFNLLLIVVLVVLGFLFRGLVGGALDVGVLGLVLEVLVEQLFKRIRELEEGGDERWAGWVQQEDIVEIGSRVD